MLLKQARFLRLSFFIILSSIGTLLYSQHQSDNWYFGINAGLNFSTGNPIALTNSQMNASEASATISDANGSLLFYTDGINVWNKLHQIMTNGTGLFGGVSSTQVMILPQPRTDSIYYIFTVDQEGGVRGLCYSTVNINSEGGLGKIVQKNVLLLTPTCEKLAATIHSNHRDIWIVAHGYPNDKYYSWLLTQNGIITNPVISSTNNIIGATPAGPAESIGNMKISPDGTKIAAAHQYPGFLEIGRFDNNTGSITNPLRISAYPSLPGAPPDSYNIYGVEFSPNSQLLYTTTNRFWGQPPYPMLAEVNQYDLTSYTISAIEQSHYYIDSFRSINNEQKGALQIASNNKIYTAVLNSPYLSSINYPDVRGSGAGFTRNAVNLNGRHSTFGLPTFIQDYYNVIPLKLTSFRATFENEIARLTWSTSNEQNCKWFEVEQKTGFDQDFKSIGVITAQNQTMDNHYSFILSSLLSNDIYFYRLKIVDIDGKFFYSNTVTLKSITKKEIHLLSSFITSELTVMHPSTYDNRQFQIISSDGRVIFSGKIASGTTSTIVKTDFLNSGNYILAIKNSPNNIAIQFFKE